VSVPVLSTANALMVLVLSITLLPPISTPQRAAMAMAHTAGMGVAMTMAQGHAS
jgi:hypothetical protein